MFESSEDRVRQPGESTTIELASVREARAPLTICASVNDDTASLMSQIEGLAQELRAQWRGGHRVGIETLGAKFEQIAKHEEPLLDLIYHEVLTREEFGERPTVADFIPRFPQLAERLERLFVVHAAIEDDAWGDELEAAVESGASGVLQLNTEVEFGGGSSTEVDAAAPSQKKWPRLRRNSPPADPPPGYELLEEIGRGGMAVVFRARQQVLNRTVAIKMLLAGSVASDEVLARIQQEAQAVARLQHSGIVQIYEVGTHRGLPYLSLEFVPGGSLHDWLSGRPLPPQEAARIVEQLARSTHFAHERGIVHRDLKPSNVLLSESPPSSQSGKTVAVAPHDRGDSNPSLRIGVKISDFGLAKMLGSNSDLTATGQVIGTPSYMAPEQASAATDDASPAQDIYSLGAILYELLTGRPPFRGATLFDTLEQVRSNEPVPPRHLQPRVPRDIETICLKCLEKQPQRRYASAQQLADDLLRFQQGDSIAARPASAVERSVKLVQRYPAVASLLALVLLLTVGGFVGISREAARANKNERDAVSDRDLAHAQWKRAEEQKAVADRERLKSAEQTRLAESARATADEQRKLAEASQTRAEEQTRIAEQERTRAVELQVQVERRFERTLQALKSNVDTAVVLYNAPATKAQGQKMLDEALRFYEELSREESDHVVLRRQRILALASAARIHQMRREDAKAESLLKNAEQDLLAMLDMTPTDADLNTVALAVYWALGVLYNNSGRPQDGLRAWQQDINSLNRIIEAKPTSTFFKMTKANAIINEAVSLKLMNRTDEAFACLEEAVALVREVLPNQPNDWVKCEASLVLHDYSQMLRGRKRTDEAQAAFSEAFLLRQQVHQRNPNDADCRMMLARMHASEARRYQFANDVAKCRENFTQAFDLLEPVVKRFPDIYDYHRARNDYAAEVTFACIRQSDYPEARKRFEKLLSYLDETRLKFPNDHVTEDSVARWHYFFAEILWEESDYDAAIEHLKQSNAASIHSAPLSAKGTPTEFVHRLRESAWRFAATPTREYSNLPTAELLARAAINLSNSDTENVPAQQRRLTLSYVLLRRRSFQEARTQLLDGLRAMQTSTPRATDAEIIAALREVADLDSETARREFVSRMRLEKWQTSLLVDYFLQFAELFWRTGDKAAARGALTLIGEAPRDTPFANVELRRMVSEVRALFAMDELQVSP